MANDDQRRGADCFQSSSGWSCEVGVSVVLLLTWSEISPVKHKHRHTPNRSLPFSLLAILPICPLTVGVLFGRYDKTGCLYISADTFMFVFFQTRVVHHDWKRDIYQLWYLPRNCAVFLCKLAYRTSFYALLQTRPHFTNLCELWAWLLACFKMSDARLSVSLRHPRDKRTLTWNHSSTQKCTLVFFSPLTKQQTRWAICARCTWFPTLNCRGICF